MLPRFSKSLLLLDGSPQGLSAEVLRGEEVHRADGALAAAQLFAQIQPGVILVDASISWQVNFVSGLPPDRRPAVVAMGEGDNLNAEWADEWVMRPFDETEVSVRLKLARQRARLRRRALRRAFVDALTGLPNRRAAVRGLMRESARSRRDGGSLSLCLFDLDDFKRVNEQGGHPAGDRLLRQVGAALRKVTRGTELCARVGGDEFAIVVPSGTLTAERAIRRARDALRAIGVSASAAACEWNRDETLKSLYRRSDIALKAVKDARRAARLAELQDELPDSVYAG